MGPVADAPVTSTTSTRRRCRSRCEPGSCARRRSTTARRKRLRGSRRLFSTLAGCEARSTKRARRVTRRPRLRVERADAKKQRPRAEEEAPRAATRTRDARRSDSYRVRKRPRERGVRAGVHHLAQGEAEQVGRRAQAGHAPVVQQLHDVPDAPGRLVLHLEDAHCTYRVAIAVLEDEHAVAASCRSNTRPSK